MQPGCAVYKVSMTEATASELKGHLLGNPEAGEEICFAGWRPAAGSLSYTAILSGIMPPGSGDRVRRRGGVSAMPRYVDRCKEASREAGEGIAMVHTHPDGEGHQDVSAPDLHYEQDVLAEEAFGVTGLPLVGMTLAGDGTWSARMYPRPFRMRPCSAVKTVGRLLRADYHPDLAPPPAHSAKAARTASVWGAGRQADIARLRIGVVGAGSVGSAVCEALARMGAGSILVMDYDRVQEHNLDRMLGASAGDVGLPKIDVVGRNMRMSATLDGLDCKVSDASVAEQEGAALAKDCDVLFSCVDRPWPRDVLNRLSYSCLIPVVDGGIFIHSDGKKLSDAVYRAQTVGPGRACLGCLGALDAGQVQRDRDGMFDDPGYIGGAGQGGGARARQNVMPFVLGLAGLELMQFVELTTGLAGMGDTGQQAYDYAQGEILPVRRSCEEGCAYAGAVAQGDASRLYCGTDKSRERALWGKPAAGKRAGGELA